MSIFDDVVTIDFETLPIESRPTYPPEPVGVAIKYGRKKGRYLAWGHVNGGNNCSWADARSELGAIWCSKSPILCHNAGFDIDVAETHMGMPRLPWERIHDTLPMLFLQDPRIPKLSLKPASEALLDWPAAERDLLIEWLMEHQPLKHLGIKLGVGAKSKHPAGAYVAFAPVEIAGPYAIGDVDRAYGLFRHLYKELQRRGMLTPYDRERRLMFPIMRIERRGARVDIDRLRQDCAQYELRVQEIDRRLRIILKNSEINLDSGAQLADALIARGLADVDDFDRTATGKLATNKASLRKALAKQHNIAALLQYRAQANTCLRNFIRPWLEGAERSGGRLYNRWFSTRTDDHGARTGRLSSSPNWQNIPKKFKPIFANDEGAPADFPVWMIRRVSYLPLPVMRSYIIPEDGHVLIDRDYSQQELRILGHYEGEVLAQAYRDTPWMDIHEYAQQMINEMLDADFDRVKIKTTGFGLIYGMGLGKLAESMGTTVNNAKELKNAYLSVFPGLKGMYREMRRRAEAGESIRTWGGREYYCEPPIRTAEGRWIKFDYKMLNILIQGSAADCTKEAFIRFAEAAPSHYEAKLTVHDEILVSVPRADRDPAMRMLQSCMDSVKFDVPMLSEGKWSDTNWAQLQTYDKKGKIYAR